MPVRAPLRIKNAPADTNARLNANIPTHARAANTQTTAPATIAMVCPYGQPNGTTYPARATQRNSKPTMVHQLCPYGQHRKHSKNNLGHHIHHHCNVLPVRATESNNISQIRFQPLPVRATQRITNTPIVYQPLPVWATHSNTSAVHLSMARPYGQRFATRTPL